jgi:hypothetical protein
MYKQKYLKYKKKYLEKKLKQYGGDICNCPNHEKKIIELQNAINIIINEIILLKGDKNKTKTGFADVFKSGIEGFTKLGQTALQTGTQLAPQILSMTGQMPKS